MAAAHAIVENRTREILAARVSEAERRDATGRRDAGVRAVASRIGASIDPLSLTAISRSAAVFERPTTGWKIRTETSTRVWSERARGGQPVFRYVATLRRFIGADEPFEQRTVEGSIERTWV